MPAMFRVPRTLPTPWFGGGLVLATLIALGAGTQRPRSAPQAAPGGRRIVVTSLSATEEPGRVTLPAALARAAADPADNLIEFDPALSPTAEMVIRLNGPLALEGQGGGHDRIDGGGAAAGVVIEFSAQAEAGLVIGGNRKLTLAGLVLKGGRQRTLLLKDEAQLVLEDVAIRESGGPGAALFGKSRLTAARCSLSANRTHGLELHGQSAATLTDSDLHANVQSGAAGFDESTATLSDCRLVNNGEWNVVLSHNAQAELSGCLLQQGRFAGLDVSDSAQARCRDCRIEDGRRFGVFATGSSTLELTRTSVRRNGGRGIEVQDRARLTLDEARIEDNRDYGVILFGQTAVKAVRSTFTGNGAHGASLRGPASGVFLQCGFSRNRYSGVGCLDGRDGGRVRVSACTFTRNGMRPIYRGPLHIDPLVPTPLAVNGRRVECLADPNAVIELYLDRIGEASRYLRAVRADGRGRFQVDGSEVPAGWVMTASATVHEATSEFNVVAGTAEDVVLGALLGRTGVFSDDGGEPDAESLVRRWRPGTRLTFELARAPSPAVERYLRFLAARVPDWTGGALTAEVCIGTAKPSPGGSVTVSIRYLEPDASQLMGRGGVTFMKWDAEGYFEPPMHILLASASDPDETCPRVLAHEVGHALGLNHTRIGLLSRMQGSTGPGPAFLNDFSPTMTYYDVLALQVLHDPRTRGGVPVRELLALAAQPRANANAVAAARPAGDTGRTFSPADPPAAPAPKRSTRRR